VPNCKYIKKTGHICNKKASGVRCLAHRGKRNKLRRKKGRTKKLRHTQNSIQFYDVRRGKPISVSRRECKILRSSGRGGDLIYAFKDNQKFFTFVPRGFKL